MEGVQERGISLNDVLDCRLLIAIVCFRRSEWQAGGFQLLRWYTAPFARGTSCVCSSGPTASVAPPGSLRIVPPHQRLAPRVLVTQRRTRRRASWR